MHEELRKLRADFREMRDATRAVYERPECSWCGRHRSPYDVVERRGLRLCSGCVSLLAQIFAALRDEEKGTTPLRIPGGAPEAAHDLENPESRPAAEASRSVPVLVVSNPERLSGRDGPGPERDLDIDRLCR